MQIYELVVNKIEFFGKFVKYGCDILKYVDWCISSFPFNFGNI